MTEWQPIETAPRDRTEFEAKCDYTRPDVVELCYFEPKMGQMGAVEGPWIVNGTSFLGATHWRPVQGEPRRDYVARNSTREDHNG